jgi:uncharacterized SAM-binding protein YcdF (DUF218 family)
MLSAFVSLFLSPLNWIIILIVLAWYFHKQRLKKVFIMAAITVFVVFGNQWLLNVFARNWQPAQVAVSSLPVYDCGIVAGGFASPDAKANGYFNATADRFIQAVKIYKSGKINHILISGGNGKDSEENFREAAWVRGELLAFGVPDSAIITEDQSNNTRENALNSKRILDSFHLKPPFLLITSAWHMPRAKLLFEKSGVPVDGFPCNYMDGMGSFSVGDLVPHRLPYLSADAIIHPAS